MSFMFNDCNSFWANTNVSHRAELSLKRRLVLDGNGKQKKFLIYYLTLL